MVEFSAVLLEVMDIDAPVSVSEYIRATAPSPIELRSYSHNQLNNLKLMPLSRSSTSHADKFPGVYNS